MIAALRLVRFTITINQLVDMVEQIAGVELERRYDRSAPQGVVGRNSDNELIKKLLGWEPSIPLEVGLRATYEWIDAQMRSKSGSEPSEAHGRATR
jgi:nucleoside-diphosphate-sugar epimerase